MNTTMTKALIFIGGPLALIAALSIRPSRIEKPVQCGPSREDLQRPFKILVTVYDSAPPNGPLTCSGKRLRSGMIAADLLIFPVGTKIFFDNMWHIVEDCGGAIKGLHIDKFVPGSDSLKELWRKDSVLAIVVRESK